MTPSTHKRSTHEAAAVLPSVGTGASPGVQKPTDPAKRHAMIAEAAFFIAQSRGFYPSQEVDDWLAAEREIDQLLSKPEDY